MISDKNFYTVPPKFSKIFRENMLKLNGGKPKEICFEALKPEIEFEEKYGVKTPLALENLNIIKKDFSS